MIIGSCKVYMNAPFSHSLKEKRMVVKSLIQKVRNKYNVSIAEVEDQDLHQSIVIGIVAVSTTTSHANSIVQNVINYIEEISEADIIDSYIEII
ncbi:hypothetical protein SDC9_87399 [bioreactor metagenome]|uniref:YlxP-like protein n=1 Tax=bioreactor metagenome TaxID=1076179 RepID=A0A644ZLK0_9ZZZZ